MKQTVCNCRNLSLTMLIGLLMLSTMEKLPFADAQSPVDCCLSYSAKPLPLRVIRGYVWQYSNELCSIDAVIFHTRKRLSICANPKDKWVQGLISGFLKRETKKN
ncbi:C-C motif chemokine 20-like [Pristis pectinata]|uniref:C-C motif chemokine 20-like n=1 Tax=Pristis pectinata TaxID=685728 RepID=UPI00223E625E|nr:C-C motif chemokine 20-like [Pristis pectinata]